MFLGAVGGPGGDYCAEVVHCPEGAVYCLLGNLNDEWQDGRGIPGVLPSVCRIC